MILGLDPDGTFPTTLSALDLPYEWEGVLGNRLADISSDAGKVQE
jgi:hypothetical protein